MTLTANPTILALDGAGSACSAALWRDGSLHDARFAEMEYGHAEVLMPMVEAVVANTGYDALDLISVGTGPGGYTGLRIAISTARALALATQAPALGLDNFDIHRARARAAGVRGPVAVVLETRRDDVYLALYDADDRELIAATVAAPLAAAALIAGKEPEAFLTGDAATRFSDAAGDALRPVATEHAHADAATLAALAAVRFAERGAPDRPPSPLYLRAPDVASPQADRQRLRR